MIKNNDKEPKKALPTIFNTLFKENPEAKAFFEKLKIAMNSTQTFLNSPEMQAISATAKSINNKVKSWFESPEGKERIKAMEFLLNEMKKANEEAEKIKELLEDGSMGDFIGMKPISGLTFLAATGGFTRERDEFEKTLKKTLQEIEDTNKKRGIGGKRKGKNAEDERNRVRDWYKEGKKQRYWSTPTEAKREHKKWLEALLIVAELDNQKLAKLNSARIAPSGDQSICVNETCFQSKAKFIVEKMNKMTAKPDKEWKQGLIKDALIGID